MKRRKICFGSLVIVVLLICCIYFIKSRDILNLETINNIDYSIYLNIDEYSDDDLDLFLESINNIEEQNKEFMLIVTSLDGINDDFGAKNVIEGPNNQYFIEYTSLEEQEYAYQEFSKLGVLVDKNEVITLESYESSLYDDTQLILEDLDYDLQSSYNSWGIEAMGLDVAINIANDKDLEDVVVAIVDSGLDIDLFEESYPGKLSGTYNILYEGVELTDETGHGTHIAGTIAEGTSDNVSILSVKVAEADTFYISDAVSAINYIVSGEKADVINLSSGSNSSVASYNVALLAAKEADIIVVAAAGNDSVDILFYPASYDSTISVASVDSYYKQSYFSNYGNEVTFAAPGSGILSINGTKSGTSMATPHIVCAVALLKSYQDYTLEEVKDILIYYADDLGDEGYDSIFGYGFVNLGEIDYCDDASCAEPIIYGDYSESAVTKIEVLDSVVLPEYDYDTISNLGLVKVKITYEDDKYLIYNILELEDLEISGYDPDKTGEQTVTVSYNNFSDTFIIDTTSLVDSVWEYEFIDSTSIRLTEYLGEDITTLYIPSEIDNYTVSSLGEGVLGTDCDETDSYYSDVSTIILPSSVTQIDSCAFQYNKNINSVISYASGISVGESAFSNTDYLNEFIGNINSLGDYAFFSTGNLGSVTLADGITKISYAAFYNSAITSINIPSSVSYIASYAFAYSGLISVELPSSVTQINSYTFYNAEYLESVSSSASQVSIGYASFAYDYSLVNFSGNISTTSDYAFYNCSNLEDITFAENIETIGNYSFAITNLGDIVLPDSLLSIGQYSFGLANLTSLEIGSDLSSIGVYSFIQNSNLEKIVVNEDNLYFDSRENSNAIITEISGYTTLIAASNSTNVIPSSVDLLYNASFSYRVMDSLYIPEGVLVSSGNFQGTSIKELYLPRSLSTESFTDLNTDSYSNSVDVYRVYSDVYEDYNLSADSSYITIDAISSSLELENYVYYVGDEVDTDDISLEITYGTNISNYDATEKVDSSDLVITYQNGTNFKSDDDAFTIILYNEYGLIVFEEEVEVSVYSLSEIVPVIEIEDKTYDGTDSIDLSTISVSNIDSEDYSIVSAILNDVNAGNTTADVTLKLSDETYLIKKFENGLQEATFTVDIVVNKADSIIEYTSGNNEVTYDGNYYGISLNIESPTDATILYADENGDYTLSKMPTYKDEGEYKVNFKLSTNDNYKDIYGSETLKINPAQIVNFTEDLEGYQGEDYSLLIDLEIQNYEIYYSLDGKTYNLTKNPNFSEAGEYTVYYKVVKSNYETYYSSNKVTIYGVYYSDLIEVDGDYLVVTDFNTNLTDFSTNLGVYSKTNSYTLYNSSNIALTSTYVKSGDIYNLLINNYKTYSYSIVVLGDVYADGKISSLDYVQIKNHIMETKVIDDDVMLYSADANNDGKISALDYVAIKNYIMGGN